VEAALIRQILHRITSNRRDAASIFGISVRSLQYKWLLFISPVPEPDG